MRCSTWCLLWASSLFWLIYSSYWISPPILEVYWKHRLCHLVSMCPPAPCRDGKAINFSFKGEYVHRKSSPISYPMSRYFTKLTLKFINNSAAKWGEITCKSNLCLWCLTPVSWFLDFFETKSFDEICLNEGLECNVPTFHLFNILTCC